MEFSHLNLEQGASRARPERSRGRGGNDCFGIQCCVVGGPNAFLAQRAVLQHE